MGCLGAAGAGLVAVKRGRGGAGLLGCNVELAWSIGGIGWREPPPWPEDIELVCWVWELFTSSAARAAARAVCDGELLGPMSDGVESWRFIVPDRTSNGEEIFPSALPPRPVPALNRGGADCPSIEYGESVLTRVDALELLDIERVMGGMPMLSSCSRFWWSV